MDVEEITEVERFKKVFFPSGFDGATAGFTVSRQLANTDIILNGNFVHPNTNDKNILRIACIQFLVTFFVSKSSAISVCLRQVLLLFNALSTLSTFLFKFQFRALMGKAICTYQVIKTPDPKLQNVESIGKCIQLLNFLRFVTQVILPRESLCWLVFNGMQLLFCLNIGGTCFDENRLPAILQCLQWCSVTPWEQLISIVMFVCKYPANLQD